MVDFIPLLIYGELIRFTIVYSVSVMCGVWLIVEVLRYKARILEAKK